MEPYELKPWYADAVTFLVKGVVCALVLGLLLAFNYQSGFEPSKDLLTMVVMFFTGTATDAVAKKLGA